LELDERENEQQGVEAQHQAVECERNGYQQVNMREVPSSIGSAFLMSRIFVEKHYSCEDS
jgi:hypothetical protein